MKRAGIVLLVACAVLVVGSAAGALVRATSRAAYERLGSLDADETPEPSHFSYLPSVFRSWSPGPAWVTVLDEGFESESPPGDPWKFCDANHLQQDAYCWGPRSCPDRASTGDFSAWAVGGGASGASLPCGSGYPANVDSWMVYGPFSLQDATDAYWRFSLWLDTGLDDWCTANFCWYADTTAIPPHPPRGGQCLTLDSGTWWTNTIDLSDPDFNVLGGSQVWIGFQFTSLTDCVPAEGAYVDDVVVRKCVGGTCPPVTSSASVRPAGRIERSRRPLPATLSFQSYSSAR